jgi:hypothetical protein
MGARGDKKPSVSVRKYIKWGVSNKHTYIHSETANFCPPTTFMFLSVAFIHSPLHRRFVSLPTHPHIPCMYVWS